MSITFITDLKFGTRIGAVAAAAAVGLLLHKLAAPREPRYAELELGKPITMMPISKDTLMPLSAVPPTKTIGAVHMTINWEGASIGLEDPGATIKFYRGEQNAPFYTASWTDLKRAYRSSGCSNNQIGSLDGALDAVLICDGRLGKLSELSKIEVFAPKEGETKVATAFSAYNRPDDVLSVMVQLY